MRFSGRKRPRVAGRRGAEEGSACPGLVGMAFLRRRPGRRLVRGFFVGLEASIKLLRTRRAEGVLGTDAARARQDAFFRSMPGVNTSASGLKPSPGRSVVLTFVRWPQRGKLLGGDPFRVLPLSAAFFVANERRCEAVAFFVAAKRLRLMVRKVKRGVARLPSPRSSSKLRVADLVLDALVLIVLPSAMSMARPRTRIFDVFRGISHGSPPPSTATFCTGVCVAVLVFAYFFASHLRTFFLAIRFWIPPRQGPRLTWKGWVFGKDIGEAAAPPKTEGLTCAKRSRLGSRSALSVGGGARRRHSRARTPGP